MAQETWLVVAVGAGFLLLGIAASPLGWAALLHRRARADRESERGLQALNDQVRDLLRRLERCESGLQTRLEEAAVAEMFPLPASSAGRRPGTPGKAGLVRAAGASRDDSTEPKLIKVPRLAPAQDHRAQQSGLSQRYAAIWELADAGASPDAIARATGQPIGQIELILGLRRQLGAGRNNIPHASHE